MNARQPGLEVFPELAAAACRADRLVDYFTWAALRGASVSHGGSGLLPRADALAALRAARPRLRAESLHRLLRFAEQAGYCRAEEGPSGPRLRVTSAGKAARMLGVVHVSTPHLVPLDSARNPTGMRAQTLAAQYPLPDHSGALRPAPSRSTIEKRTGIAERTQRSLEARFSVTTVVQEVYARVEGDAPVAVGHGLFADGQGRQRRRLPDLRTPADHQLGSRGAARSATYQAKRGTASGSPAADGPRPSVLSPRADHSPSAARDSASVVITAGNWEQAWTKARRRCDYCASRRSGECRHRRFVLYVGTQPGSIKVVISERAP